MPFRCVYRCSMLLLGLAAWTAPLEAQQAPADLYRLVWVDRAGAVIPVDSAFEFRVTEQGDNVGWSLSPDGKRLAIGTNTDAGDQVWIKPLPAGKISRLSSGADPAFRPRWSRDGRSISFIRVDWDLNAALYQRSSDGSGPQRRLAELGLRGIFEASWAPDGKTLLIRAGGAPGDRDIAVLRPGVDSIPVPLIADSSDACAVAISPDGRWVAYESDETGRAEVYIRPFPNVNAGKWQVSTNGGVAPLWASNSSELFFVNEAREMMMRPIGAGSAPRLGEPNILFRLGDDIYLSQREYYTPYDIAPDGTRFIMAQRVTKPTAGVAEKPLRTRWAADVVPERVLPEYPRPQLVRKRWISLNGRWDYAVQDSAAAAPEHYERTILVPFAIESQLSGVTRRVSERQRVWYRRTFQAPRLAQGERLLLHFGAVDWEAVVYVNGREVTQHLGGLDPFSVDITDALRDDAEQELVVRVWDPTDRGGQPRGKQVQQPRGIMYTPVTGIWQTVWLEPVPATYISDLTVTPDIDAGTVTVRVDVAGVAGTGIRLRATANAQGRKVASAHGAANQPLVLRMPKARLWSPSDPFLYDLDISLSGGDAITSYAGMRKIAVGRDAAGTPRLFLNNQPLFQYGPLDQGWWPDGLYTAPTDEALRWDIEATKQFGFNMIRKHVKVEPARWYYHADRLGMLVWQDMPSISNNPSPAAQQQFERELRSMVNALRHFPSIVMWVPFNEGWGQHDTERYAALVKELDPTRLVNNASGWTDRKVGDVVDAHVYPGPGMPVPESGRALVLGEFGGLGLPLAGHTWLSQNNWGYRSFITSEELDRAYRALLAELRLLIADGLAAAVYTQTTDVETEVNGLITYDREVTKISPQVIAEHASLYRTLPARRWIVPTSTPTPQTWRYTTSQPDATWMRPDYDDSEWRSGVGGFGAPAPSGFAMSPAPARTPIETPNIWLRRSFELGDTSLVMPQWRIYRAGDVDLYLNGKLVARLFGGTNTYVSIPFTTIARRALRPGRNTLAVQMRTQRNWRFIDVGIEHAADTPARASKAQQAGTVAREVILDFNSASGTIKDANGIGTGFSVRLPRTGGNLPAHDPNLAIDIGAGMLKLTTTRADPGTQKNLGDLETIGIDLSALGFTGKEDFSVAATFVRIPGDSVLDSGDQLGIFAGTSRTSLVRAGLINADRYAVSGSTRSNTAFSVITNGREDSSRRYLGLGIHDVGTTMAVEISRTAGTWSIVVNGEEVMPNTGIDGSGNAMPPAFLDGQANLVVGVFGLDLNGVHKQLQLDRFVAKVFSK